VRDTYSVSWEGLTRSDANTIDTFLRTRGGHEAFKWTPPGTIVSRNWLCTEWRVRHYSATLDTVTATFVEDFSVPP
jgi:phage-related protein